MPTQAWHIVLTGWMYAIAPSQNFVPAFETGLQGNQTEPE